MKNKILIAAVAALSLISANCSASDYANNIIVAPSTSAGSISASHDPRGGSTLTAIPSPGWYFQGWSGSCSGNTVTCWLKPGQARAVVAVFGRR